MSIRENPELAELLAGREAPCLSLYQPTHRRHPENHQNPIRYKNLVKELEESLKKNHPTVERRALLSHFHALADDHAFWNHILDGLAVFGSHNYFRVFKLQRPVGELAVAANSFHIKPSIRILQSAERFQVLAITRKAFRMFEGNRDVLDEIHPSQAVSQSILDPLSDEPAKSHPAGVSQGDPRSGYQGSLDKSGKEDADTVRFFRAVDRAILAHHSKPSGVPLILAALGEHQTPFRELSHNPHLLPEGIDVNPEALTAEDLRERAWKVVEPHYLERLASLSRSSARPTPSGKAAATSPQSPTPPSPASSRASSSRPTAKSPAVSTEPPAASPSTTSPTPKSTTSPNPSSAKAARSSPPTACPPNPAPPPSTASKMRREGLPLMSNFSFLMRERKQSEVVISPDRQQRKTMKLCGHDALSTVVYRSPGVFNDRRI